MAEIPQFAFGPMDRGHFINGRGRQLYRCLHRPAATPRRLWVLCHPLLEDATFGFRTLTELADAVARSGDAAMRFDLEGHGDSEGDTRAVGLADWVDDTVAAVAWARAQCGADLDVVLVSMGTGAWVAAGAAARCDARQLVLIDPVLDGGAQLAACLHAHTTMQLSCFNRVRQSAAVLARQMQDGGTVSLAGHDVGRAFADSLRHARLPALLDAQPARVDAIAVLRPTRPAPDADWTALASRPTTTLHTCAVRSFLDPELRYWELPVPLRDLVLRCVQGMPAQGVAP